MKAFALSLALLLSCLIGFCAQALPGDPNLVQLRAANTPTARQLTKAALEQQAGAFLNEGRFEGGVLYLLSGQRVPVAGLRYHVGQHLVEVQDSMQADSTTFWPLSALRGFDLGTAEDDPATVRRYRLRLVHEGRQAGRREAVQILTATDNGPLVLAYLPVLLPGTQTPAHVLLAGAGRDTSQPLRTLDPRDSEVLRLVGAHANQVKSYATENNLHCSVHQEVAQLLNYYNRLVVAVE